MITPEQVRLHGGEMSEETVAEINKMIDKITIATNSKYGRPELERAFLKIIIADADKRERDNILSLLKNIENDNDKKR